MAKATAEAVESLPERIAAAEQRIAALRDERAQAVLSSKPFDNAALSAAESELEGLEAAQAVQHRQAETAARDAAEKQGAALRKEGLDLEEKRLAAVEQAEAFARSMVDALLEAEGCRAEIEARFKRLALPWAPGRADQDVRLARSVCAVLTRLTDRGTGIRWGDLTLRRGFCTPGDAWTKQEDNITGRIKAALSPEAGSK